MKDKEFQDMDTLRRELEEAEQRALRLRRQLKEASLQGIPEVLVLDGIELLRTHSGYERRVWCAQGDFPLRIIGHTHAAGVRYHADVPALFNSDLCGKYESYGCNTPLEAWHALLRGVAGRTQEELETEDEPLYFRRHDLEQAQKSLAQAEELLRRAKELP